MSCFHLHEAVRALGHDSDMISVTVYLQIGGGTCVRCRTCTAVLHTKSADWKLKISILFFNHNHHLLQLKMARRVVPSDNKDFDSDVEADLTLCQKQVVKHTSKRAEIGLFIHPRLNKCLNTCV